jgi:hypothetical protein
MGEGRPAGRPGVGGGLEEQGKARQAGFFSPSTAFRLDVCVCVAVEGRGEEES